MTIRDLHGEPARREPTTPQPGPRAAARPARADQHLEDDRETSGPWSGAGARPSSGATARASSGWASVTACPNGPLLVRGDVEILLASGEPAPRRRATVALCRCGASGIKPYCDGSHKAIGFRTDDEPA